MNFEKIASSREIIVFEGFLLSKTKFLIISNNDNIYNLFQSINIFKKI